MASSFRNMKAMSLRKGSSRLITNSQLRECRLRAINLEAEAELELMTRNEKEQRSRSDGFWGVDFENMHKRQNQELMRKEEHLSAATERQHKIRVQQIQWEEEYQKQLHDEAYDLAMREMKMRQRYMKALFTSATSEVVYQLDWDNGSLPPTPKPEMPKAKKRWDTHGNELHSDPTLTVINPEHLGTRTLFHLEGIQQARALTMNVQNKFLKQRGAHALGPLMRGRATTPGIAEENMLSMLDKDSFSPSARLNKSLSQQSSFLAMFGPNANPESLVFGSKIPVKITEEMKRSSQAYDGHPYFKWDQELILREVFDSLDVRHVGALTAADVGRIASSSQLQYLLSFTVFGSLVKKRQWKQLLQALLGDGDVAVPGARNQSTSEAGLTIQKWFTAAMLLAQEKHKSLRHIRTEKEHLELLTFDGNNHSLDGKSVNFATCAREQHRRAARDTMLLGAVSVGSVVWALHGGGCTWMPAVVEAVHMEDLTLDVKFPLSQPQLRALRKKDIGADILSGKIVATKNKAGGALGSLMDGGETFGSERGAVQVHASHLAQSQMRDVWAAVLKLSDQPETLCALNAIFAYNS